MKITKHVKRWNKWRKHCLNGPVYKFLVLVGIHHSPTMFGVLLDEEEEQFKAAFDAAFNETRATLDPNWVNAVLRLHGLQELTDDESVVK